MQNFLYVLFVAVALALMVGLASWGVKRDRKHYKEYKNGRVE